MSQGNSLGRPGWLSIGVFTIIGTGGLYLMAVSSWGWFYSTGLLAISGLFLIKASGLLWSRYGLKGRLRELLGRNGDLEASPEPNNASPDEKRNALQDRIRALVGRIKCPAKKRRLLNALLINFSRSDSVRLVRLLIDMGSDVHATDGDGWTALMKATAAGSSEVVNLLLECGADPNGPNNDNYGALLILSVEKGNLQIVESLVSHGANVEPQKSKICYEGEGGRLSPLEVATWLDHFDIVKVLIDSGAEVTEWALDKAQESGHEETFHLLAQNYDYDTSNHDTFEPPPEKESYGSTPLILEVQRGDATGVEKSLTRGSDPDLVYNMSRTALMLACINGHSEIVELLLDAGAKLDVRDAYGYTPLMLCAQRGRVKCAKLLLEKGADVNQVDNDSRSALMWAVGNNRLPLVAVLLEAGADSRLKDTSGRTALHLAQYHQYREIELLLWQAEMKADDKH